MKSQKLSTFSAECKCHLWLPPSLPPSLPSSLPPPCSLARLRARARARSRSQVQTHGKTAIGESPEDAQWLDSRQTQDVAVSQRRSAPDPSASASRLRTLIPAHAFQAQPRPLQELLQLQSTLLGCHRRARPLQRLCRWHLRRRSDAPIHPHPERRALKLRTTPWPRWPRWRTSQARRARKRSS